MAMKSVVETNPIGSDFSSSTIPYRDEASGRIFFLSYGPRGGQGTMGAAAAATVDASSAATPSASIPNKGVKRKHSFTEKRMRMLYSVPHTLADSRAIPLAMEVMTPQRKSLLFQGNFAAGIAVPPAPRDFYSATDTTGAPSGGGVFGIWGADGTGEVESSVPQGIFHLLLARDGGSGDTTAAPSGVCEFSIWGANGNGEVESSVLKGIFHLL